MTALTVLVCDDEPLAARRLVSMLGAIPDVSVVGTAANGAEALQGVADLAPDLLLLDIEMPGPDGFDVIDRLLEETNRPPLVAFVTAHRNFAPDAFDTDVIDFLPKPVRRQRLERAICRARDALLARSADQRLADLQANLDELRKDHVARQAAHVWVSKRNGLVRIELSRIDRIAAEGAYVRIHVGDQSFLHRDSMAAMEDRLDRKVFVRVHRSHVVRADFVETIRRTMHGSGELVLSCGAVIPVGRKYAFETRRHLLSKETRSRN
jgi:DNA-binding LytR/AlgR family response regulator